MTTLTLLPRLLRRNAGRLLLAFGSLLVGAVTLAVVLGLIGSVERFFVSESRALLGGDITIEDDVPIDPSLPALADLREKGAAFSLRTDTLVVVQSEKPATPGIISSLLVSLKVVDEEYPLYGTLITSYGTGTPSESEVFVAEDILTRMGVTVGETLTIGKERFTVRATIVREPDSVGGSFRLGPLAIISSEGWARTGIDQKQSRVEHTLAIKYPETITLEEASLLAETIKSAFPRPGYRVAVASDGPSSLLRILDAAERFFFTMIVLALFLVVVNIRLNLIYFLASFQKTIAIMRSLGMRRSQLFALFLTTLLFLSVVAGIAGGVIGNILADSALPILEEYIDSTLPGVPLFEHVFLVALFTGILCLFSATGFLSRVLSIEPKMLLLGYGSEHGRFAQVLKELPTLALTLLGLYGGVYYLTEKPLVALYAVASITGVFVLLFLLARAGISIGHKVRFSLPFTFRSIMNFLKHQGLIGTTAIASLTIALASIFAIALIERNVLGNLGTEFKADAPNIYLIDIQEDQLGGVRSIMGPTWRDFAMVRARFTMRDGYDIQANLATEDGELRREFNITSATTLIDGETLVGGAWHGTTGTKEVSVERDFAERAKLTLGSRVEFYAQGVAIEATVTSIREVTTTNGLPFFFLVFSPDVLAGIPRTSFGYAYVEETKIPVVQNELARAYPNISSIPTTQILEIVARVVGALSGAVVATAVPALALGVLLIIAMLAISVRERGNDMLVFTAFGARTNLLFSIFLFESGMIVLLSGIFATVISHVGVYLLGRFLFDFTRFYVSFMNALLFAGVLLMTLVVAYIFAKRFTRLSPMDLLRERR